MYSFKVIFKEEAFKEMTFLKTLAKHGEAYKVIGTVGDRLLVLGENNEMIEIYPRKCLFAGWDDE